MRIPLPVDGHDAVNELLARGGKHCVSAMGPAVPRRKPLYTHRCGDRRMPPPEVVAREPHTSHRLMHAPAGPLTHTPQPATQVLVSIAVGPQEACTWVEALIRNALRFTWPTTRVAMHLHRDSPCGVTALQDLFTSPEDRFAVNSDRLPTVVYFGSVLYAHLLNARFAATRWPRKCCTHFVFQASNMLWLRPQLEQFVQREKCSVSRQGWHGGTSSLLQQRMLFHTRQIFRRQRAALNIPADTTDLIRNISWASASALDTPSLRNTSFLQTLRKPEVDAADLITAIVYLNLTGARWPRGWQAWDYHEDSFYPFSSVLSFLTFIEGALSKQQLMAAGLSPEEWWLQAWVLNREPALVQWAKENLPGLSLCGRYLRHATRPFVPESYVISYEKALRSASCRGAPLHGMKFAWKRFARDVTDPVTARALKLQPNVSAPCLLTSNQLARARSTRRR